MSKLAAFLGSTGLAVLMTAAGLIVDFKWLVVTGLVLLALSALAFGISRFWFGSTASDKLSAHPPPEIAAGIVMNNVKNSTIIGGTVEGFETGVYFNSGDNNLISGFDIRGPAPATPKADDKESDHPSK